MYSPGFSSSPAKFDGQDEVSAESEEPDSDEGATVPRLLLATESALPQTRHALSLEPDAASPGGF